MWYRHLAGIAALWLTLLGTPAQAQEFTYTINDLGTLNSQAKKRSAEFLRALAYAPDGKTLVSAGKGGFFFWNADTGKSVGLPTRAEHGTGVAFSPDGKSLYTADAAGQLLRWDAQKRQVTFRFPHVYANIERINLSGDGSTLVTVDEQYIIFWDARTGKFLHTWNDRSTSGFRNMQYFWARKYFDPSDPIQRSDLSQPTLSPDGLWCANQCGGLSFEIRSTKSAYVKHQWPQRTIASIDIAPDGKTYAVASRDGAITLVESETLKPLLLVKGPCADCGVRFSPDAKTLIAHQPDVGVLAAYDLTTGKPLWHHRQAPVWRSTAVAFSPDGRLLATGDSDHRIRIYDLRTGRIIRVIEVPTNAAVKPLAPAPASTDLPQHARLRLGSQHFWHPNDLRAAWFLNAGKQILLIPDASHDDGATAPLLYDTQTGKLLHRLTELHRKLPYFNRAPVEMSPDRRHLLVCAGNRLIWWNLETSRIDHEYQFSSQLTALAISRDGKRFAVAGAAEYKCPQPIHVWDLEADRMTSMQGHDINIAMLTFSPDGSRLYSSHSTYRMQYDGEQRRFPGLLIEWDASTGQSIRSLEHKAEKTALSPDGNTWCFYLESMSIDLFDWKLQKNIVSIKNVEQFLFSPDGAILALGGNEKIGGFWDVRTGKELCKFQAHVELGTSPLCFSDDGKTLATRECAGDDRSGGSIRLWDVATGAELCPNPSHRGAIECVAYSPDGRFIVSAGNDRRLLWWDAQTGKLVGEFLAPGEPRHRDLRRKFVDFIGHIDGVTNLRFSGDGRFLVSGSFDRIVVWDVATRKIVHSQRPGGGSVVADIALNRVGTELCVMESDGSIRTWDVPGNKLKSVFKVYNHKIGGTRIAVFSPDATYLAVPETDENEIQIWHVAQQKLIRSMPIADPVSADSERRHHFCVRLTFSPDSRYLAGSINQSSRWHRSKGFSDSRNVIAIWELAGGGKVLSIHDIGGSNQTMAFSPDGRSFFHELNQFGHEYHYYFDRTTADGRRAVLRDLTVGVDLVHHKGQGPANVCETTGRELPEIRGAMQSPGRVAFAPNGKALAAVDVNRTLLVWDTQSLLPRSESSTTKVTPNELAQAWEAFGDPASAKVFPAIWRLTHKPAPTLAFLKTRLTARTVLDPAHAQQLLRALDSNVFSVRAEAMRELEKGCHFVEPLVRAELARARGPEYRRRLESLLARLDDDQRPECLQMRRGIEVVERLDHPDAGALLAELARGPADTRITREACAALERWEQRRR